MLSLSGSLFGRRRGGSKDATPSAQTGGGGKDDAPLSARGEGDVSITLDDVMLEKTPRGDQAYDDTTGLGDASQSHNSSLGLTSGSQQSHNTTSSANVNLSPRNGPSNGPSNGSSNGHSNGPRPPPIPPLAARRNGPNNAEGPPAETPDALGPTGAGADMRNQTVLGGTTGTVPNDPITYTLTNPNKPLPPGGKRRTNKSRRKVEGAPKLEDGWRLLEDPDAFPDADHMVFSTILEAFSCRICNQVMAEPVAIIGVNQSCGHQACESCVKKQLAQGQSHCTVCNAEMVGYLPLPDLRFYTREAVTTRCPCGTCKSIATVEAMSRHIKNDCKHARWVCCLSDEEGHVCGVEVARGDWAKHRHDCPYAPIMCLYEGCPEVRLRKEAWAFSRHYPTCPYRTCTCVCGETYMFRDQEKHRAENCNLQEVSCKYCGQRMHRHQLAAHQADPKLAHVHLRALVNRVQTMETEKGVLVTHINYVANQLDDGEDDYGAMARLELDDKGSVSVKRSL